MNSENLDLGSYNTEDEAAFAYNVALDIVNPGLPDSEKNHGMVLSNKIKEQITKNVRTILRKKGFQFLS